jgi:hypothetical protein
MFDIIVGVSRSYGKYTILHSKAGLARIFHQ